MKKVNLYIDGNYLCDLIEKKIITINFQWQDFTKYLLKISADKFNFDLQDIILEKASVFFTKKQKQILGEDIIKKIELAKIDIFTSNDSEDFNVISNSLVWQASKNSIKDPYEICILIINDDYELVLNKLKEKQIYTVLVSDSSQEMNTKLQPDLFVDLINIDKVFSSSAILICPYCKKEIQENDYINHLCSHNNNQEHLYSKNLKDKINCCFCNQEFSSLESKVFFEHLVLKHSSEFFATVSEKNGLYKCKRCNSVISGCHPMVIIQHITQNCHK